MKTVKVLVVIGAIASMTGYKVNATEQPKIDATRFGLPSNNVRNSEPGWRVINGEPGMHVGIDLSSKNGNGRITRLPFQAGVAGTAYVHENSKTNTVTVVTNDQNGPKLWQYLHASKIHVRTGEQVTPTTVLGETGDTGSPGSTHLHVQVVDANSGNILNPDAAARGNALVMLKKRGNAYEFTDEYARLMNTGSQRNYQVNRPLLRCPRCGRLHYGD